MNRPEPVRKTYSHLAGAGRIPTDYEVATTQLLYHPAKGFEVALPIGDWYDRYQRGSALAACRWEDFRDPRQTTYTKYVALQAERSAHVEGVLRMIEETGYDARLDSGWVEVLVQVLGPARFLWHAFQMLASYIGQLAPEGRIAVVFLLQAADEMRRVHALAYRLALLRRTRPNLAAESRRAWEQHPAWQPLRRAVEQALVAWDFGEALVALNLCVKPLADVALLEILAETADARGDHLLPALLFSLAEDATWQRATTVSLLSLVLGDAPERREAVADWARVWLPRALEGAEALGALIDPKNPSLSPRLRDRAMTWLEPLGLHHLERRGGGVTPP